MFEAPIDAWYVWIGLAVVSSTVFGVVSALPAAQPPDADGIARTVDAVAASEYAAIGKHPLSNVDSIRVGTDSITVRGPGGTAHAGFGYEDVTPVRDGTKLEAVLRGRPPDQVYDSPAAFGNVVTDARSADPHWRYTDRLLVRRLHWEGVDAIVVG